MRIDATTMEALEVWAADEFRSVNGQLQWIIADALRKNRRERRSGSKAKEAPVHDDNLSEKDSVKM